MRLSKKFLIGPILAGMKSFFLACSVYSRIPVPQFAWREEDMKYMLCFFPWIGAVIGGCIYLWDQACIFFNLGAICRTALCAAIPLLITGGFHADGFLDVMDALHSYQPRERKLEILKDSHIGAFAVIMFAIYGLLYLGAFSEIKDGNLMKAVCSGFFLSRCLCGISVLSFPLAKREGMLYYTVSNARKGSVKILLYLQGLVCMGCMIYTAGFSGLLIASIGIASFAYYFFRCRSAFGGITGDTSGYFVLLCELGMVLAASFVQRWEVKI